MSQKQRRKAHQTPKQTQTHSLSQESRLVQSQVGDHYQGDKESCCQRRNSIQMSISDSLKSDDAADIIEKPEDGDVVRDSSEIDWSDQDENAPDMDGGNNRLGMPVSYCLSALENAEQGGFAREKDSILVVKESNGIKCVVGEDFGLMYFYARNHYPFLADKSKATKSRQVVEKMRTFSPITKKVRVLRAIAQWLNDDARVNKGLADPMELIKAVSGIEGWSQAAFVKQYGALFDLGKAISGELSEAVLEWQDGGAIPLRLLFKGMKKRRR